MTWAEFCIRSFAYRRKDKELMYKFREVAYASYISSNISLKKIPKINEFMPLDIEVQKKVVTKEMLAVLKRRQLEHKMKIQDERQ